MIAFRPIAALLSHGLDLLLPPRCYACGTLLAEQGRLCGQCWSGLTFITEPCCRLCGYPFDHALAAGDLCAACLARPPLYAGGRSALVYDEASRGLILAFKRGDRTELARPLAGFLLRAGAGLLAESDLIVPVPLHPSRLFARRFNQSALLAKELARLSGLAWDPALLARIRRTRSQGGLTRHGRRLNVRGAFGIRRPPDGRHVLLVDDVLTTGATLEACTRVLRKAGAQTVRALTLARVATPGQIPI